MPTALQMSHNIVPTSQHSLVLSLPQLPELPFGSHINLHCLIIWILPDRPPPVPLKLLSSCRPFSCFRLASIYILLLIWGQLCPCAVLKCKGSV